MINLSFLKTNAEKMGVLLDDTALERFALLAQMLVDWNGRVNLTAITEPDEIVMKHFIDSITPLAHIDLPEGARVIDVGCGAGFPGLPILIARPDLKITFLDSISKKLSFIEAFLHEAGLFGETLHERAEIIGKQAEYREQYNAAFTRAVAPLNVLAEYCLPLVQVGGTYISMKGAQSEAELGQNAVAELGGEIERVIPLELPNADRRNLVFIKKVSHTATKYPRKSKKIDTAPL